MENSQFIIELNPDNFQQVVMQGSMEVPVLVDFWADWCQPCKILMPLLAKLAEEYQGKFILAKLNTEEHQQIAAEFGIRSLPTVKLFMGGQPVDEFMGALPETDIREFLDKHIPRESDNLVAVAQQHLLQGDGITAITMLQRALEMDPDNHRVTIALAQAQAAMGQAADALALLDALPLDQQEDPDVQSLRSHLHFEALAENSDPKQLQQRLQTNNQDHEARLLLAAHHVVEQNYPGAMDLLLELMQKDRAWNDQAARTNLLKIFDILGDDPMVSQYRTKMMNLLY